jgi:hypothetical protein
MKKGSSYSFTTRCYESHKPMPLPNSKVKIYGGSCGTPIVKDADVYIGFDSIMRLTPRHYPWTSGHEILFQVQDMSAPKDAGQYRKLVEWTKNQLDAGAKVHAGCIGGHGRTGMFLAALVSLYGEKDAVTYVREHYCKKAVESVAQMEFLKAEFDVKVIQASKTYAPKSVTKLDVVHDVDNLRQGDCTYKPLKGEKGIWG